MKRPVHCLAVLTTLAACFLVAAPAPAQTVEREGIQAEGSFRATTLVGGAFPHDEQGPGVQAALRRLWPSGLSLAAGGIYAEPVDLDLPGTERNRILREQAYYAELRYQVQASSVVQPYAGVRAGWRLLESRSVPEADGSGGAGELLLGADVWASDRVGLRVSAVTSSFRLTGFVPDRPTAGQAWSVEMGLAYFFGSVSRDRDGDGADDDRDRCPGTPGGVEVDADGCPPDSDGDGRPDLRDACPGTPEGVPVDERGCARDSDGDGVPDGRDECEGTPADQPVNDRGCVADADADGVADRMDACPDTPTASEVDPRGCARDGDEDGVPDGRDRCPGTVRGAAADEEGCSEAQAGLRSGRFTVTGLPFRFREVQVNEELEAQLEQIGEELRRNPSLGLEIRVYTDTLGPAAYNQQMSQRLAEAARDFLLRRDPELSPSRLQAVGMGEAEPGGQGGEAEGRGSTRVVFVVRARGEGEGSG